jgi:hypothetical protein
LKKSQTRREKCFDIVIGDNTMMLLKFDELNSTNEIKLEVYS